MLSKSQCWNVDGRGVFCLQVRPGSYWRLEILEFVYPFLISYINTIRDD